MEKPVQRKVAINEGLQETKFGRFNYCLILISGLILFNVVMECCGICFVLPVINCDITISYQEKGVLGAVSFLGIICSSHLWGFLADTTGRKNVIQRTLIAGFFVTAISSLSPNYITLVIMRFLNGFLISGGSATIFAYLGEFHSNELRSRALMSAAFTTAVACIFSPIIAWAFINQSWLFHIPLLDIFYVPWRLYILVCGIPGLFCGLCLLCFPESPKYLLSEGKDEESLHVLRKIFTFNTGRRDDEYTIAAVTLDKEEIARLTPKYTKNNKLKALMSSMWHQTAPLLMREHCRKTILACIIQFWTFFTAHGLYVWFPYILNRVMQYTNTGGQSGLQLCEMFYLMEDYNDTMSQDSAKSGTKCSPSLELTTYEHSLALELIFLVLFLGVGYFITKIGRRVTLFAILLICGVCGIFSAIITIPIVAVYMLIILLICGPATTVLNVITVDIFPTHLRAMAMCISLMAGRIGSVLGTNIVGALLERHCQSGLLLCSIALALTSFLSFLLPGRLKAIPNPKEIQSEPSFDLK